MAHERAQIAKLHWAPEQNGFFAEATVPGMLMNVDFMVKGSKRFTDNGGWGHSVLDCDTARISIDTFVQLFFLVRRGLIANVKSSDSNGKSNLGDLMAAAARELGAFINAVTDLYGADQARLAAEDWLLELEMTDLVPELSNCVWRTLTIVSASRLAVRLNTASGDTKVSPIRSSNCSVQEPLA